MNSTSLAKENREQLLEPREFTSSEEETLRFIGWVTLAPSTHNTQPWKFDVSNRRVGVSIDRDKAVVEADPQMRDMFISSGALLRHIELVGGELNAVENIDITPRVDKDEVARFSMLGSDKWDDFVTSDLAKAIFTRQNYRADYSDKEVKTSDVKRMADLSAKTVGGDNNVQLHVFGMKEEKAQQLCDLTTRGIASAYESKEFRKEVSSHINNNFSKKDTGLHGYSLTVNNALSILLPVVMRRVDLGPKLSQLNKRGMLTSQGMVVATSENDNAESWLDSGRIMMELILRLKSRGIQTSIYAAAIEIGDSRKQVESVIGQNTGHAQLLFTYGYPTREIGYSHRQNPASVTTFR